MRRAGLVVIVVVAVALAGVLVWRTNVPAPADAEPEASATLVSVRVGPVVCTTLRGYVPAWGSVEPQQATATQAPASARISTPVAGVVAHVACAEGQRVAAGTVLFRLDSRVADISVEKAKQALQYAEQVLERQKKLGAGEATSQRLYLEAEQNVVAARNELRNAETQRSLLDISSPLDGTLVRVSARPGDAVDQSTALAEVIDLRRLVIAATVRSVDVPRLRMGQDVEVFPGERGSTSGSPRADVERTAVAYIGPQVDSRSDTVQVRMPVPPGSPLRPGQFVNLRIVTEVRRDCLAVPTDAVVTDAAGSTVAILTGDTAVKRPVRVGLRDGDLVEVEGDGLRAGMTVVTAGAYGLPERSKVKVIRQ
jgi:membrane fusion protein (multidrug efflux system)